MILPDTLMSHLHRADGSATYSQNGYSIIGAANGPIEVGRRDELPEEATIDVIVRPAAGVGGTRERHLESIIHSTLQHVILTQNHPRSLIQVTLQVIGVPDGDTSSSRQGQRSSLLHILPSLLQASLLALLSASIPLSTTFTTSLITVSSNGNAVINPSLQERQHAKSTHVLAFSAEGDLLVVESQGNFVIGDWERILDMGLHAAQTENENRSGIDGDVMMLDENREGGLRALVRDKIEKDQKWKESIR
ncbi:MAG: exosome non-catalytic core subunit rrp46 [Trichoglossum hirsutum]|nr:MAG: exosome non-catalytic core subunit rrp46 [Trichoglossum hirsutum]